MISNKLLTPLLVSIALNLFLLGMVTMPLLQRARRDHAGNGAERGARNHEHEPQPAGPRGPRREPRRGPQETGDAGEQLLLHELVALLGGPASDTVRPILEKNRNERHTQRQAILSARREAGAALTAVPFSEEGLTKSLSSIAEAERARKQAAHQTVVALARLLSDEQRTKLRARFPEGPPRER